MAKIYSKKSFVAPKMKPKKEVISFLLNYSKALKVVKTEQTTFEFIANYAKPFTLLLLKLSGKGLPSLFYLLVKSLSLLQYAKEENILLNFELGFLQDVNLANLEETTGKNKKNKL